MRRIVGVFFALFAVLGLTSCGSDELEASDIPEITQTVAFVKGAVDTIRAEERFESPSQVATYLTSADGLVEFLPPDAATDPEGAAAFTGLVPHKDVAIWPRPFVVGSFRYFLLVEGDDEGDQIKVSAYNIGEFTPLQVWWF